MKTAYFSAVLPPLHEGVPDRKRRLAFPWRTCALLSSLRLGGSTFAGPSPLTLALYLIDILRDWWAKLAEGPPLFRKPPKHVGESPNTLLASIDNLTDLIGRDT